MTKRKIIILLIISAILIAVFITAIATPRIIFEEKSADKKITVQILSSDIFNIGTMGGYSYTLIVKEQNGLFFNILRNTEFYFINDGATLSDNNIKVIWLDNSVKVEIDSEEMNRKSFYISF